MNRLTCTALLVLSLAATTALAMLTPPRQESIREAAAVRVKAVLGKPAPGVANAGLAPTVGALLDAMPRPPKPTR
jgi:hypothetical protein